MARFRLLAAVVSAVVLTLAFAGCADSSGGDGDTAEAAADAPTGPTVTLPEADEASGEPIAIGFVNSEGGSFSVPELGIGSEMGVDYVNTYLGGAGGRPLEVVRCNTDGSPEASIDCANQMVEAGVVAVQEGTDLGGDAMVPILADAGIPLVGHVQFGPARMFDDNSTYFGSAALAYGAGALSFYAEQGAESVRWFLPDDPSSHAFHDSALAPTAEALGLDYDTVYFDAASPDWSTLATTVLADAPDVSGTIAATDGQCVEMISALRGAGYDGSILAASCSGLYDELGADAVGVEIDADHWKPGAIDSAPDAEQADLEAYIAAMTDAGEEDLIPGNAQITFADTVNLAAVLGSIEGEITPAALAAALDATVDLDGFAGPPLTCDGSLLEGNSACATDLAFYQVQDDGSIALVSDGFVDATDLL